MVAPRQVTCYNRRMDDVPRQSKGLGHTPVLAEPVLRLLAPKAGEIALDCTVGRAGHAALLAQAVAPDGRLVAMDVDSANVAFARDCLADAPVPVDVVQGNFAQARQVLDALGIDHVDVLLADLGFASSQMDDPARGLSFQEEGPLDMRLDPTLSRTAADLVNDLPERELADLIYRYGEERLSRKIARKIVDARGKSPILSTRVLAEIVRRAHPPSGGGRKIDPATRTFMALRIAVNAELEALEGLLSQLPSILRRGGRAAIISFHSLEDRQVKQTFNRWREEGVAQRLTKKPVVADDAERAANPRSRSAKLRAIAVQ